MLFRELLEQDFSSKATALEQVPATYKEKSFDFNNCDIMGVAKVLVRNIVKQTLKIARFIIMIHTMVLMK